MSVTEEMLSRYAAEIEQRQRFADEIVETAQRESRDISQAEQDTLAKVHAEIEERNAKMAPLAEKARIDRESNDRIAELHQFVGARKPATQNVEYRSAGDYMLDMWRTQIGDKESAQRLEIFHRAAAHQKTSDNPGLIPAPVIAPVLNFVDSNRPLVSALGPRDLPGQTWSRPKVTQHTSVGLQPTAGDAAAEKAELVSQKMTITKLVGTAVTYGGYVNVSRQDLDFSQPGILDIVISDLAAQYAIQTEAAAATAFTTAAATGTGLGTGANTAAEISGALWAAAASIYTATKGIGRVFAVIPPGLLALWGPLFPPVNPTNAQSSGFNGGDFGSGPQGNIAGIPIYVSNGVAANTCLVFSSAAAEVYEQRVGALSVVEPSVLGLQVAYAGYFTPMAVEATGIIKIIKTP